MAGRGSDMLAFLGAGMFLGVSAGFSPGPLFALVLSHTIRHGVREGIKVAAAPLLTDLPIIIVSTFVLSRFAGYKGLLGAVSLAGAAVLAYMAYETFRAKRQDPSASDIGPQSLTRGAMVNALSPHPYLFWLTVGAPMILKGWKTNPAAAVLFVVGFTGCLVGSKVVLAVLADRSSHLLDGKRYDCVMRILGLLLLLFAGFLLRDGLRLLGGP
ncbi:MAG: LysE family translocator [Deltaproteobacteria bacterium]|nr:LysE family translocator [Deltaproteobacteria bacterium]